MPHKQNPVRAEMLVSLASFNATLISAMHRTLLHEQERSGSAWALEWMVLPQMAVAAAAALEKASNLIAEIRELAKSSLNRSTTVIINVTVSGSGATSSAMAAMSAFRKWQRRSSRPIWGAKQPFANEILADTLKTQFLEKIRPQSERPARNLVQYARGLGVEDIIKLQSLSIGLLPPEFRLRDGFGRMRSDPGSPLSALHHSHHHPGTPPSMRSSSVMSAPP